MYLTRTKSEQNQKGPRALNRADPEDRKKQSNGRDADADCEYHVSVTVCFSKRAQVMFCIRRKP